MKYHKLGLSAVALTAFIHSSVQAQVCTGAGPCLTFAEPNGSINTLGYGGSVAILSDYDGGGKRELAIVAANSALCYFARGESGGAAPAYLASAPGAGPGSVVLTVGDLDAFPGEEIAVSNPGVGWINFWSIRPAAFGGGYSAVFLYSISGPQTLGTAMVMVDTLNGRRLAVGVPGQDLVRLYSLTASSATQTQTLVPWTPGTSSVPLGNPTGNFGRSMAVGPKPGVGGAPAQNSLLAVGAPNYSSSVLGSPDQGFVAIFDLSQMLPGPGQNEANGFLYRGVAREQIGTAVASVGFLPEPSPGSSPRSDFVVLGRSQNGLVPGVLVAFHTPNGISSSPTQVYGSPISLISPAAANDGRLVSAGDVDGDGLGDFVMTLNSTGRLFSTAGGNLSGIGFQASYGGITSAPLALASGPDVNAKGATDVVIGAPRVSGSGGLVEALPLAANVRLPNPISPAFARLEAAGRPLPGPLQLRAVGPQGSWAFLFGGFAPPVPVPFLGGPLLSYLPANFLSLDAGIIPASGTLGPGTLNFAPLTVPLGFNFEGLVYQVLLVGAGGSLSVSNGLLSRVGSW
jgi:hypothetical protein